MESLPADMQQAFKTQDTPLLKASFAALPDGEREEVYRKVVDSGLWVPQGGGDDEEADDGGDES